MSQPRADMFSSIIFRVALKSCSRSFKKYPLRRFRSATSIFGVCPPPLQQVKRFPKRDFVKGVAPLFGYAKVLNVTPGRRASRARWFASTELTNSRVGVYHASR